MAIKPILFNTEMVRVILDGRKSCTRRIVKGFIPNDAKWGYTVFTPKGCISCRGTFADGYGEKFFKLPYQPEDTLYIREAWNYFYALDGNDQIIEETGKYYYRATDIFPYEEYVDASGKRHSNAPWRPSIHMPKEAARIFLRVTNVRAERLQEITEVQSQAEGIRGYSKDGNLYKYAVTDDWWIDFHNKHRKSFLGTWWQDMPRTAKDAFSYLWNSTIKPSDFDRYGWGANPWVWVIEFERCERRDRH